MYKGKWEEAFQILSRTNDFPEFTGRICPALCEKSCVLKLSIDSPVTIREDECAIIEAAFREDYVTPKTYARNGKRVAVIGSGPAGYTAGIYTARAGLKPVLVAGSEVGGQLISTPEIGNWPGEKDNPSGFDLMQKLQDHAKSLGTEIIFDTVIKQL